jgi:hypothetical protein
MTSSLKPWYTVATPHEDIREGRLSEAVSRATIRRVLGTLRADGKVVCLGSGRNAQWRRLETRS